MRASVGGGLPGRASFSASTELERARARARLGGLSLAHDHDGSAIASAAQPGATGQDRVYVLDGVEQPGSTLQVREARLAARKRIPTAAENESKKVRPPSFLLVHCAGMNSVHLGETSVPHRCTRKCEPSFGRLRMATGPGAETGKGASFSLPCVRHVRCCTSVQTVRRRGSECCCVRRCSCLRRELCCRLEEIRRLQRKINEKHELDLERQKLERESELRKSEARATALDQSRVSQVHGPE